MITQIFNINDISTFKRFGQKYENLTFSECTEKYTFELRNIPSDEIEKLWQSVPLGIKIFTYKKTINLTDILIPVKKNNLVNFSEQVIASGNESLGLQLLDTANNYLKYDKLNFVSKNGKKNCNFPLIMGILNVTPDSFSDGGKYFGKVKAVEKAYSLINDGADIIDIGGESTRPGAGKISVDEELKRVLPVIEEISKNSPDVYISIDTTKSKVAEAAVQSGASIINDISGMTFDPEIVSVAKKYNTGIIIMHIKGTPAYMQINPYYEDVISEIYDFLSTQTEIAKMNSIKNIWIDPGIGFGKRIEDNIEIIKRLKDFSGLGFPILIGLSRKSFLGKILDNSVEERDIPTLIAESFALRNGAKIIRTHNVKNAVQLKNIAMSIS